MGDYHFVYKDLEGASTQWDDIQRKLGNLPAKPPAFKPPPFTPASDHQSKDQTWLDSKTFEELKDHEDDLDDDRFLQEYRFCSFSPSAEFERKKRLAEMQEAAKVLRLHMMFWVVVVLYKEGIPECGLLLQSIEELAVRYPATKLVKIISTDCIPNYPDQNVPTLLVYNNGAVKGNYVGLHSFGRRCTPEGVALVLCQSDPVLNDGHNRNEHSREAVVEGVRKRFIEKVVADHEEGDDEYSSD
ncbi:hypothetical protein Fmac_027934 [Flemingia macrophylla]|uniref:Phosducin domain-containing protein n=1 Tax=Flemingia macrophylla TaxID=520843 RepID=A0ABD1LKT3_9FABA